MNLKLHLTLAETPTKIIDLTDATLPTVIGRDSEVSQVVIPDSQSSRAHCSLDIEDEKVMVEDMGSRNGTWLNGQPITRARAYHGDILKLGKTHITFEIGDNKPIDPLVGQRLGGFELQEVVGRGRYGTVFKGSQINLGRQVAIKVLAEEYRDDPEKVQSFLTEARRAGRLNHPHLVQVHDVCQVSDNYLLIMELMKGSTADILRDHGPLGDEQVLHVIQHIGRALGYAESQRLVHRDVKPDNILVNEEGLYKLADLGIAAPIADNGQATQERIFGSPHYIAPEQARGGAIDGRADLYGLGATAWHLLTGKTVFQGSNRQVVLAHINTEPEDLDKLAPNANEDLIELIEDLLEKDPDDRPRDATEVVAKAEEILKQPPRPKGAPPRPRMVKRVRRRRRYRG
ncbi:MAG: protein kinase [Planctomycetes bacterium]|nr:protein kinase [Planctomycetota bacterium]